MSDRYVVIHGHFYQPPRENPWLEAIQREESAYPYHDWDERIAHECYLPNATSRIVDSDERILDLVNNYAYMNFNFGPTLLNWMKTHSPKIYQAMITADQRSLKKFGHGNAIAQCYNHMIMPLANARDQVTQARWGIKYFESVFGRYPEAMWLAETGINDEVVRVLIEHKLRYVILAPNQAWRLRRFGGGDNDWVDVSNNSIDPRRPYRIFWKDAKGKKHEHRFIDVFFYDGPLSRAIAFERLMTNASRCAERIEKAFGADNIGGPRLVNMATDGETFGHHEPFSDMCLAYLLKQELPNRGIEVVNYGRFLDIRPPAEEVELKPGNDGTGTSWSCAHGVDRWRADCGCHIGWNPRWNQQWRGPLRESLNWLRDQAAEIYENEAQQLLKDPWRARNDYISVVMDRSDETVNAFIEEHAVDGVDEDRVITILLLLEMQRQAMLMFTSCGWFFDEISGLETVQILKYASRCMQLAKHITDIHLEPDFLEKLSRAQSNIKQFGNGADVYDMFVRPSMVTWERLVTQYAIAANFSGRDTRTIYHYKVHVEYDRIKKQGRRTIRLAQVTVTSGITRNSWHGIFLLGRSSENETYCFIKKLESKDEFKRIERALFLPKKSGFLHELARHAAPFFGTHIHSINDLLTEEKELVLSIIFGKKVDSLRKMYHKIFDENRALLERHVKAGLHIARELRVPCEIALSMRIADSLRAFSETEDFSVLEMAGDAAMVAQKLDFKLDLVDAQRIISAYLTSRIQRFREQVNKEDLKHYIQFLNILQELGFDVQIYEAQNAFYDWLSEVDRAGNEGAKLPSWIDQMMTIADYLHFNVDSFKERFKVKA